MTNSSQHHPHYLTDLAVSLIPLWRVDLTHADLLITIAHLDTGSYGILIRAKLFGGIYKTTHKIHNISKHSCIATLVEHAMTEYMEESATLDYQQMEIHFEKGYCNCPDCFADLTLVLS